MLTRSTFKRPTIPRTPTTHRVLAKAPNSAKIVSVAVAYPKSPRAVNKHLLSMSQGMPCLLQSPICNHDSDTSVACHGAGIENGKGMGYKVGDHMTVTGCSACNDYTDAFYRATKAEKKAVFETGHKRQVQIWETIAADPLESAADRRAAQWALDELA